MLTRGKMTYQYNAETKKILQDWIIALKQNNSLDESFVVRLGVLVDSAEIGDSEKIHDFIKSLDEQNDR
jgi:hypothetical protein